MLHRSALSIPEQRQAPLDADLADRRPGQIPRRVSSDLRHRKPLRAVTADLLRLPTASRLARLEADGEEQVGYRLVWFTDQNPGWHVLHSVHDGDRLDVDHLVVGPGGVFAVSTLHKPGVGVVVDRHQIRVGRRPVPMMRDAMRNARRAAIVLTRFSGFQVPCVPVVVVTGAPPRVVSEPYGGSVVADRQMPVWLSARHRVLSDEQVEVVYAVARHEDVWVGR